MIPASTTLLHRQLVPRTRYRLQQLRHGGIDFDLVADAMHELFEQLTITRTFVVPHLARALGS